MQEKEPEKKPIPWEVTDPKPPIVRSDGRGNTGELPRQ